MSWRWAEERELLGQYRIRMVARRRPRRRTSRGDESATFAGVEPIDNADHGPLRTEVKYRRVIAELLAIAAAQHPSRLRPQLGPGDPVGHPRARLEPDPPLTATEIADMDELLDALGIGVSPTPLVAGDSGSEPPR